MKLGKIVVVGILILFLAGGVCAAEENGNRYSEGTLLITIDPDLVSITSLVSESEIIYSYQNFPGMYAIKVPNGYTVETAIEYFSKQPGVISVSPDYILTLDTDEPSREVLPIVDVPSAKSPFSILAVIAGIGAAFSLRRRL